LASPASESKKAGPLQGARRIEYAGQSRLDVLACGDVLPCYQWVGCLAAREKPQQSVL